MTSRERLAAFGDPPEAWQPVTTEEIIRGRHLRVWRWNGHELAHRSPGDRASWEHFRTECWRVMASVRAGSPVIHHAHERRHDHAHRVAIAPPAALGPPLTREQILALQPEDARDDTEEIDALG